MENWLKLCAICTLSTYPDPRHYNTLLNADVLYFYLTLHYYNQIAQIWCQSDDGLLS